MNEQYLAHNGILGQRWGIRNGPPYPLSYNKHSSAEKSKNPKSKLDNYSNDSNSSNNSKTQSNNVPKSKKPSLYSSVKKMSSEDIKVGTDRMKSEKQYVELATRDITQGRNYAEGLLVTFGTTTANTFVKSFGASLGAKAGNKLADLIMGNLNKAEKKAAKEAISSFAEKADDILDEIDKASSEVTATYKNVSANDVKDTVYVGEPVESTSTNVKKKKLKNYRVNPKTTSIVPVQVSYKKMY